MSDKSPTIGILTLDNDFDITKVFGLKYKFFISSAFVKWIESAGAKVVPIWAARDEGYYRKIMSQVNGILFPGGKFYFNDPKDGRAAYSAHMIYNIAKEMNDKKIHFPIWGTCLGFELFFYAASGGEKDSRFKVDEFKGNLPLTFEPDFAQSKLFGEQANYILEVLKTKRVNYNRNIFCVDDKILKKFNIVDWKILSTETHKNGIKFISSAEHKTYPFFGVMSHPEKVQFEDHPEEIPHSVDAVKVSQYFANFFVSEARKNDNSFGDKILRHLICNFPITYTGPEVKQYRQCYLFEESTNYPVEPVTAIIEYPEEPEKID